MAEPITLEWLQERRACDPQLAIFMATFPTGVAEWTRDNVVLSLREGIDLLWFSKQVLSAEQLAELEGRVGPTRRALETAEIDANVIYTAAAENSPAADLDERHLKRKAARAVSLNTLYVPRRAYRQTFADAIFEVYEGPEALENARLLTLAEEPSLLQRVAAAVTGVFA